MPKEITKNIKSTHAEDVENKNALKHLFGPALLKRVASSLSAVYPKFNRKSFLNLSSSLVKLEMKPRIVLIRDALHKLLPADYEQALNILLMSARQGRLKGFELWPYTEFVQTFGLDHVELSLMALRELTEKFTAEWAVRPFLRLHQKVTLDFLKRCASSENVHWRRWASEGSRPRLPWGERLHNFVHDPTLTLPILEKLKFDSEIYVRKSVANHLNDISKDHPEFTLKVLARWQRQAGSKNQALIDWTVRRSLRTLIKNGNLGALKLIGVSAEPRLRFSKFEILNKNVKMGERLDFEFELVSLSKSPQNLVVDYVIHFVKANKSTAPKVFKLKTMKLGGRARAKLAKSHHLKKITTRDYYSGEHLLEIQINGSIAVRQKWRLKVD